MADKEKRIPVKNKDTGATVYKTPDLISRKPELYEKLPEKYDRNPKGKPHMPKLPGDDHRPGPPRLVKRKKPKPPKKVKKPISPVPLVKQIEPQKDPVRDTVLDRRWDREAMNSTLKLANRYVFGGEITKDVLATWKKRARGVLKRSQGFPQFWPETFEDGIEFVERFQADFNYLISNKRARESVKDQVDAAQSQYKKLRDKVVEVQDYLTKLYRKTKGGVEGDIGSHVAIALDKRWFKMVTKREHLFVYTFDLDTQAIDQLISRAAQKATPEEVTALSGEGGIQGNNLREAFLKRSKVLTSAKHLNRVKTQTKNPVEWLDWVLRILQVNYTHEGQQDTLEEFDLYGMKVVIDDTTVDSSQIQDYVEYLKQAYTKLKAKGFGAAWYGTVYIECKECGGENPNSAHGVGGHYMIGKDTVTIYSRPSDFIVELMVHELGHRFWFKSMNQAQRLKFESLVKTHTTRRPSQTKLRQNLGKDPISKDDKYSALHGVDMELKSVLLSLHDPSSFSREDLSDFISWAKQNLLDLRKDHQMDMTPGDNAYFRLESDVKYQEVSYEPTPQWVDETDKLVKAYAEALKKKIDACVEAHNVMYDPMKAYNDSYDNNPAPVTPVSDYGKSNADEAFAEAFMHYVLERGMTGDQMESFKQVLKKQATGPLSRILRLASRHAS